MWNKSRSEIKFVIKSLIWFPLFDVPAIDAQGILFTRICCGICNFHSVIRYSIVSALVREKHERPAFTWTADGSHFLLLLFFFHVKFAQDEIKPIFISIFSLLLSVFLSYSNIKHVLWARKSKNKRITAHHSEEWPTANTKMRSSFSFTKISMWREVRHAT